MEKVMRADVAPETKWNHAALFPTWDDFNAELDAVSAKIETLGEYKERLSESPKILLEYMTLYNELLARFGVMRTYLSMANAVDTQDDDAKSAQGQLGSVGAAFAGASAFANPEMLAHIDTLIEWANTDDDVAVYGHYFDYLKKSAAHMRSAEVEELLGTLGDIFSGTQRVWGELVNNDLQYPDIVDADGNKVPRSMRGMLSKDREIRRQTWASNYDAYLSYKNTLITNYINSAKQNVFMARAKGYNSVLEYRLEPTGLTLDVFHNLINTFRDNLSIWHRFAEVKKKALGYDEVYEYDLLTSVLDSPPEITFHEAVDIIGNALTPLGDDYVAAMRKGCLEEGWVDWGKNANRRGGAFSSASYNGSPPYIFMGGYMPTLAFMSTLAHELGHSMNLLLLGQAVPSLYNGISEMTSHSVLETPSNFHQAMTRAHLRKERGNDKDFQIAMIEEAMMNFHRYFFLMPSVARFELAVHTRIEERKPMNVSIVQDLMREIMAEGYGDAIAYDADHASVRWGGLVHVFIPFYSFQYAIGISAAHAVADDVLDGKEGAVENYMRFLQTGNSAYAMDSFKIAGVDMSTAAPIEKTYAYLSNLVDQYAELTTE